MKCLLVIGAEKILRDADTDRLSVIDLIEYVVLPKFPALMHELQCLIIISGGPEDTAEVECSAVLTLEGHEMFRAPVAVHFAGRPIFRQIFTLDGVVIPGPGVLKLALMQGDQELGAWDVLVVSSATPQLRLPLVQSNEPEEEPAPAEAAGS